jgi:hypothetical protein
MRSVSHQMFAAKFPLHRDLAGFDFASSKVDQSLVRQRATLEFTDTAQNVVLIGGPGTGKTHMATAMAVSGIATKGKRVRFYSTVDLVNVLEREKPRRQGGPPGPVVAADRPGRAGRAGIFTLQPGRRCPAVPLAVEVVRTLQGRHHDQPELLGMVDRV